MTVTRTELAGHIEAAFMPGPASRASLLAYAAGSHARPEVIHLIEGLPDKNFATIRDLWYHLAEVPVGH